MLLTPYLWLIGGLLVILASSELFTNALEHLGERLGISDGVTGSLLAAVATALPETIIPLMALLGGSVSGHAAEAIGTGAILGAPMMLSTLSVFLLAVSVLPRRGLKGALRAESTGVVRDLNVFLACFGLATLALYLPADAKGLRVAVGVILIGIYLGYLAATIRASSALVEGGHGTEAREALMLTRIGMTSHPVTTGVQLVLATALLLAGAQAFIDGVQRVCTSLGIATLVVSLFLIPIATELPEKVNSILWARAGKDTLAVGNITGALAFQGSLLPAIGLFATSWVPSPTVAITCTLTLVAAAWLRVLASRGRLPLLGIGVNGVLYAGFVAALAQTVLP